MSLRSGRSRKASERAWLCRELFGYRQPEATSEFSCMINMFTWALRSGRSRKASERAWLCRKLFGYRQPQATSEVSCSHALRQISYKAREVKSGVSSAVNFKHISFHFTVPQFTSTPVPWTISARHLYAVTVNEADCVTAITVTQHTTGSTAARKAGRASAMRKIT